jgi:hypothetical protein
MPGPGKSHALQLPRSASSNMSFTKTSSSSQGAAVLGSSYSLGFPGVFISSCHGGINCDISNVDCCCWHQPLRHGLCNHAICWVCQLKCSVSLQATASAFNIYLPATVALIVTYPMLITGTSHSSMNCASTLHMLSLPTEDAVSVQATA